MDLSTYDAPAADEIMFLEKEETEEEKIQRALAWFVRHKNECRYCGMVNPNSIVILTGCACCNEPKERCENCKCCNVQSYLSKK